MARKKLPRKSAHTSSKKTSYSFTIHHILAFLGILIVVCFFGLQLTQTKQSLASYKWFDKCTSNNQCGSNQKCATNWWGQKTCQNLTANDCQAQWGGGTFYCNRNLYCNLDFGHYYTNHTCMPNCRPYRTYWGNYTCGYCDSNRDCQSGQSCYNHTCGTPSCASQGGTCARSCTGGKHEVAGRCDIYHRLSCCK